MPDIFGYEARIGDTHFKSDEGAAFTFNGGEMTLVQQWNVQYNLNVQPLYECGSATIYFSAKSAVGQLTINKIVSDTPKYLSEYKVCSAQSNTAMISAAEGWGGTSNTSLNFGGVIATGIGFSGQAQNAYVTEDATFQFAILA